RDHRDLHSFPTRRSSDLYFNGYHPQYELYIDLLYNKFSDFEKHIGNLFYIIETNYEPYQSVVTKFLLDLQIYDELNRLHYIQSVDRKSTRLNSSHVKISY